ncbi:AAA family ATPase [Streptomyces iranensis]|uniref:Energy-coupling factor transporter ATP-binding protein EcfA2 n=1 Tax=Streptomyces iranensis TaxID=576784 RepID=A0A060ZVV8_9ACTN|nr:ATP-binding protein [Streptomyces iranensis]MBP2062502.1 energy-coupling factor transporter ATP-binding protein EcfA2 [Streptomyces iranensis]CDR07289.1 SMC domain protein [Streptomyces iranensis]
MYVTRLRLDGVRGFHGPRTVDLDFTRPDGGYAGWTVLAGRNGSGKTTLLRAIALCLAGNRRASQLDDDLEGWLSDGREHAWLTAALRSDSGEDPGSAKAIGKGPRTAEFEVRLQWKPEDALFPESGDVMPTEVRFSGGREAGALWSSSPVGWFHAGYGPFRRLSGAGVYHERQTRAAHRGAASRAAAMRTLFHEQAALTEAVDWLVSAHLYRLEERSGAQDLLDTVIALLNHDLLPDDYRVVEVDSDGPWLCRNDGRGAMFPLHQMSDGFRTVVALVLDIVWRMYTAYGHLDLRWRRIESQGPEPYLPHSGVVLIDEVDAHLHVSWQKRIGEWLKAHFPAIQFIVTTHSPYICQAADERGLIRLPGPDEARPPEVVSEALWKRIVYGTGDDAALSDLFGLDTPYSGEAQELRKELVALEARVVTGQATDEEEDRHEALRQRLKSSPRTRVSEVEARLKRLGAFDE